MNPTIHTFHSQLPSTLYFFSSSILYFELLSTFSSLFLPFFLFFASSNIILHILYKPYTPISNVFQHFASLLPNQHHLKHHLFLHKIIFMFVICSINEQTFASLREAKVCSHSSFFFIDFAFFSLVLFTFH